MLTHCPACDTTFRVGPEQLKARQGRVRCGQCNEVFSALDTLVDEVITANAPVTQELLEESFEETLQTTIETVVETVVETPANPLIDTVDDVIDDEPIDAVPPAPTFIEAVAETAPEEIPVPVVVPTAAPATGPITEPVTEPVTKTSAEFVPELHELSESQSSWRTLLPIAGISVAITALLLQALIIWRVEIATLTPAARPALEATCDLLGCSVGLPSKADLLSIESSDLHPHPNDAARLVLNATLRNRAPFAQTWPHLELSLTDINDRVLARRVLTPIDYLPKAESKSRGIGAGADAMLELQISAAEIAAGGYRLYVFYP